MGRFSICDVGSWGAPAHGSDHRFYLSRLAAAATVSRVSLDDIGGGSYCISPVSRSTIIVGTSSVAVLMG